MINKGDAGLDCLVIWLGCLNIAGGDKKVLIYISKQ